MGKGSLILGRFILTLAACFMVAACSTDEPENVYLDSQSAPTVVKLWSSGGSLEELLSLWEADGQKPRIRHLAVDSAGAVLVAEFSDQTTSKDRVGILKDALDSGFAYEALVSTSRGKRENFIRSAKSFVVDPSKPDPKSSAGLAEG